MFRTFGNARRPHAGKALEDALATLDAAIRQMPWAPSIAPPRFRYDNAIDELEPIGRWRDIERRR